MSSTIPRRAGWSSRRSTRGILREAMEDAPGVRDVWVIGDPVLGWESFADLSDGDAREPDALVEDRDPISYLYTSDTTSAPKGVVTSHLAVYVQTLGGAVDKQLRRGERMACVMPLFHTAQLNTFCTALVATGATGATMVLMRGFDADAWLEAVETERITVAFLLPMMIRELLVRPDIRERDLGSLRLLVYAMAPMPQRELEEAMAVFGCEFALSFGMTEMSPETALHLPEHQVTHIGAAGRAAIGVRIGIVNEDGDLLGPGEVGEIVYRGRRS